MLDRLVRGRGWIILLGTLLFGLVALNVSLLKLNAAAGHSAERAKVLPTAPAFPPGRIQVNALFWAANKDKTTERFNTWVIS
mgnify:CR=1 FL=1